MASEKRIFSPEAIDELLNGWLIHAHKSRDRHDEAARKYAKGQYALGIPALVVTTVVGTSLFAAQADKAAPQLWVGLLSIAAALLSALQTFMDFTGRSDRHRNAGVRYKASIRQIEQMKIRKSQGVDLSNEDIDRLRESLDALEDSAPVVMPAIYDRIEKKYADLKYVQDAIGLYAK